MFKETCQVTGKVIQASTIDEFLEKWNAHIESLKVKEEAKIEKPKKVIEVKAKIDKVKEVKKKAKKK